MFLLVKVGAKIVGVYPLARIFRYDRRTAWYTTLMMSTGLTFGTISALFGLSHHYINQFQYTVLVIVVILSAIIPTLIAQRYFRPAIESLEAARAAMPAITEV
jgi:Kef-type K+ transport system membrane component KefB